MKMLVLLSLEALEKVKKHLMLKKECHLLKVRESQGSVSKAKANASACELKIIPVGTESDVLESPFKNLMTEPYILNDKTPNKKEMNDILEKEKLTIS